ACLPASLRDGLRMRRPMHLRDSADGYAAILAMEWSFEIEIVLDLLEIGQHIFPSPTSGAARLPLIIVGRRASVGHLPVDRGSAAQYARLLVLAQRRTPFTGVVVADDLRRDFQLGPVEARIKISKARITVQNLGRLLAGRCVLSCFAKENVVGALG